MSVLFVRTDHAEDLEAFSRTTCALLNLQAKETRFSDNWPGGRYVYGEALGFEVRLSTADSADFPDYDFMIDFEPLSVVLEVADRRSLDGFIDIVGKHLARHGRKVARSLDILSPGSGRVEY